MRPGTSSRACSSAGRCSSPKPRAGDEVIRRRRRSGVHAVTIGALPRGEALAPSFASAAETCLDDVFGYLLYLTKDRPLAEDLTGATFETALRRWRRFDPRRGTARAWLLAIARSTALDWFRADARRRRREARVGVAELPTSDDDALGEGFSPALQSYEARRADRPDHCSDSTTSPRRSPSTGR